jgi:hypothetical protein
MREEVTQRNTEEKVLPGSTEAGRVVSTQAEDRCGHKILSLQASCRWLTNQEWPTVQHEAPGDPETGKRSQSARFGKTDN